MTTTTNFAMGTIHTCGKKHVCCWMKMPLLYTKDHGVAVIGKVGGGKDSDQHYTVTQLGRDKFGNEHWKFDSYSGGEYTVVIRRAEFGFESIACDCPDHKHRNHACKHMLALECLRQDVQAEHDSF